MVLQYFAKLPCSAAKRVMKACMPDNFACVHFNIDRAARLSSKVSRKPAKIRDLWACDNLAGTPEAEPADSLAFPAGARHLCLGADERAQGGVRRL